MVNRRMEEYSVLLTAPYKFNLIHGAGLTSLWAILLDSVIAPTELRLVDLYELTGRLLTCP